MKQYLPLLFVVLLLHTSCSMRYGHIPKVKSKKKPAFLATKKQAVAPPAFLTGKTLPLPMPVHFTVIEDAPVTGERKAVKVRRNYTARFQLQDTTHKAEVKPALTRQQVRFGKSNWKDAWQAGFIIGLILLLITGVLAGWALIYIMLVKGLGSAVSYVLFSLFCLSVTFLAILVFKWIQRRVRKYKQSTVKYNNTEYTRQEMKQMPLNVKRKHAYNNALAALLLSIFTIPLFLVPGLGIFTFGFAFATLGFLFKGIIFSLRSL